MKLIDEIEKHFKELISESKGDQDSDGDKDFADIMIARMVASGMSKEDAIKKVKDKEYNESIEEATAEENRKKFYDSLSPAEKRRFQRKPYEFGPFYDDEVNEESVEEMSTTASVPGYQTPNAFQSKPKSSKDKEKEEDTIDQAGMTKVKKTNKIFKPMESKSTYKKMMAEMYGVVNEVSYRDYKKDPTSTPQQKVNRGIMEVNKMLGEMEKIVANNLKLKTEMGVDSSHFWKATGKRFTKINERMIRIANRLKELSQ